MSKEAQKNSLLTQAIFLNFIADYHLPGVSRRRAIKVYAVIVTINICHGHAISAV